MFSQYLCTVQILASNLIGYVSLQYIGVANGISKNVGLRKFWKDLEIS